MFALQLTPSLQTNLSVVIKLLSLQESLHHHLRFRTTVLLDSGNLVLRTAESNANTSEPLWQSFDHPAHTWLPGARIRFNTVITSWKSSEDPAPGLFTLQLDPNGSNEFLIFWNRSRQYWSSGAWDAKSRIFSRVPELRHNISNVLHTSGQIQQLQWLEISSQWNLFWSQPSTQCEVYNLCGAFGSCNEAYSGGCKRKTPLHCGNATSADGKQDQFLKMARMSLPENEQSVKQWMFNLDRRTLQSATTHIK
ncbi:G-type lectin S-receptor-like serine/threonine-protein kinase [Prunus yedoensis var. nudiflora]|uniref:G-type lectin S-receptor-like serine/threonine-protein kinase n=1 Tax=Prunus yedoensis var. nudiflora TaxID=2094558 RepID=A0A314Z6D8_PRUYE|nr:G-type lectin S-receptor-like serine/threonine-protein kinase [Prunus yedoensis var. nudiflora]